MRQALGRGPQRGTFIKLPSAELLEIAASALPQSQVRALLGPLEKWPQRGD
jgi:hypothetical protein